IHLPVARNTAVSFFRQHILKGFTSTTFNKLIEYINNAKQIHYELTELTFRKSLDSLASHYGSKRTGVKFLLKYGTICTQDGKPLKEFSQIVHALDSGKKIVIKIKYFKGNFEYRDEYHLSHQEYKEFYDSLNNCKNQAENSLNNNISDINATST